MSHGLVRRCKPVVLLGIALGLVGIAPQMARAAAAKALGEGKKAAATASANVSSTNPEEAEIAATFDPVTTDPAGTPLAIQDFQMNVSYNATDLTLVCLYGIDGFEITSPGDSTTTPGLITDIQGQFVGDEEVSITPDFKSDSTVKPSTESEGPTNTNTGDQNFFTAVFTLNEGASPDTPETFTFFAGSDSFIDATDPNNGDSFTAGPDDITSASTTGSVNAGQLPSPGAGAGTVPLPASAWSGGLMLLLMAAGIRFYSRRRPATQY